MKRLLVLTSICLLWALPAMAVVFDHDAHLAYIDDAACVTCHQAGTKSITPAKSVCLECHDQAFVDTVRFPSLKTHDITWALTHRPQAKANANQCASCHQQNDCLQCHKAGFADEQGKFGNHMLNVHRSDFHVTHPIAARSNPQLCTSCHETKFCSDCHNQFNRPRASGPSHQRTFNLLPGSTDLAQFVRTHGPLSLDPNDPAFSVSIMACDTCHTAGTVTQDFHAWQNNHAREARKNLQTCATCHPQGDVCIKCHGSANRGLLGANPHPKGWGDMKGRLDRASGGKTCAKCH
jgi:hypothetical protein